MKSNRHWFLHSAFVMLGLPWLAVTFGKGDASMAVCLLLFFVVNPIYSIAVGNFSGRQFRRFWLQPAFTALLFLAGGWLIFDPGEPEFLRYAGVYLLIGYTAAGITWMASRISRNRKSSR